MSNKPDTIETKVRDQAGQKTDSSSHQTDGKEAEHRIRRRKSHSGRTRHHGTSSQQPTSETENPHSSELSSNLATIVGNIGDVSSLVNSINEVQNKRKRIDSDASSSPSKDGVMDLVETTENTSNSTPSPESNKRRKINESTQEKVESLASVSGPSNVEALLVDTTKYVLFDNVRTLHTLMSERQRGVGFDTTLNTLLDNLGEPDGTSKHFLSRRISAVIASMGIECSFKNFLDNLVNLSKISTKPTQGSDGVDQKEGVPEKELPLMTLVGSLLVILSSLDGINHGSGSSQSIYPSDSITGKKLDVVRNSISQSITTSFLPARELISSTGEAGTKTLVVNVTTGTDVIINNHSEPTSTDKTLKKVSTRRGGAPTKASDGSKKRRRSKSDAVTGSTTDGSTPRKKKRTSGGEKVISKPPASPEVLVEDKKKKKKKNKRSTPTTTPTKSPVDGEKTKKKTTESETKRSNPRVPPRELLTIVYEDGKVPLPCLVGKETAAEQNARFTQENIMKAVYVDSDMQFTWWYVFVFYDNQGKIRLKYPLKSHLENYGLYFKASDYNKLGKGKEWLLQCAHATEMKEVTFGVVFGEAKKGKKFMRMVPKYPENALPTTPGMKTPFNLRTTPFSEEELSDAEVKFRLQDGLNKAPSQSESTSYTSHSTSISMDGDSGSGGDGEEVNKEAPVESTGPMVDLETHAKAGVTKDSEEDDVEDDEQLSASSESSGSDETRESESNDDVLYDYYSESQGHANTTATNKNNSQTTHSGSYSSSGSCSESYTSGSYDEFSSVEESTSA